MPKPKTDAEEFAKTVLWHLCDMRAEIATLKTQLADLQETLGRVPSAETIRQLEIKEAQTHQALYRDACSFAKLPHGPPGTPADE